jgi:D-alanyl-D-alanine carboxypeptidase (penicillin-binding protein 5/6)
MFEPARRVSYVLAALASSICVAATPAISQPTYDEVDAPPSGDLRVPYEEPRYAAIVMDATSGDILYQTRADSPRYPASITKIMTLYLTFEALSTGRLHASDMMEVSARAASQAPTKLGLRAGDSIDIDDAMHAIAVKSANDMAVAMAEKIGGTEERFAAMMTLKAQELGMTHTRFVNANGLPDSRQVTSAHDIAILCRAVLRDYPQYYYYFGTEQFTYRGVTMNNHNGLLGRMPGVDGFKTGYTNAAGYNLAASAVRGGRRLIAVVLGGSSGAARNANVEDLLLTGFDVEQRRANGENLMLTQNLFEAPPPERATVPQAEQGDAADPIDVVLNAAEHGRPVTFGSAAVTQLAASRPGLTAEVPRSGLISPIGGAVPAEANQPRNWRVQVGEFSTGPLATHQVDYIADTFKSLFDDREGQVEHAGRSYRAVFTGFTETEARSACETVKTVGQACFVSPR